MRVTWYLWTQIPCYHDIACHAVVGCDSVVDCDDTVRTGSGPRAVNCNSGSEQNIVGCNVRLVEVSQENVACFENDCQDEANENGLEILKLVPCKPRKGIKVLSPIYLCRTVT